MPVKPNLNTTPDIGSNDTFAWKWLGIFRQKNKNFPGAIMAFEHAIELDPHDDYTLACLGDCRREVGDFRGAFTDYRKALEINPRLTMPISFLGIVCRETGNLKEGIEVINKVLEVEPLSTSALFCLAKFKWDLGDHVGSLSAFVKLIDLSRIGWYNMAMWFFLEKEERDKALFCFQRSEDQGFKIGNPTAETFRVEGVTPKDPFSLEEIENNPEEILACFDLVIIYGLYEDD